MVERDFYRRKEDGSGKWYLFALIFSARATLEKARSNMAKNPDVWYESIQLERRSNNIDNIKLLLAKGLQECPESGKLWAEEIKITEKAMQKSRSNDAIRKCQRDPDLLIQIGTMFYHDGYLDKALRWIAQAVNGRPSDGDLWAIQYKLVSLNCTPGEQLKVVEDCVNSKPTTGKIWTSITSKKENKKKRIEEILLIASQQITIFNK